MASFVTRSGALGPYVSASTHSVPVASRLLAPFTVVPADKPAVSVSGRKPHTAETWGKQAVTGSSMVTSGIGGEC